MNVFKIKHDFPKLLCLLPLIVLYCSPFVNGQSDFDYRESYLLRSGGDIPETGNIPNTVKRIK